MSKARNFSDLLQARWERGLFVSIGLDPDWDRLPACVRTSAASEADGTRSAAARGTVAFCAAVVRQTSDLVCAYKPNAAFFEAMGPDGMWALGRVIDLIHEAAPGVPVIYDAKRGDIGSTNEGYARDAFERLGADAITVQPYLGEEALRPFLDRADKGVIVLCRTSNPGGGEFQDLPVDGRKLYEVVAERIATSWNRRGNCAAVVGATYPDELLRVRRIVGDLPILIPGIGAQGGDVARTVAAGQDARGRGMIINSSRAIIYASSGEDFAEAARRQTLLLHDEIQRSRTAPR